MKPLAPVTRIFSFFVLDERAGMVVVKMFGSVCQKGAYH